ncbi:hypothetical protein [Streptomyces asiaticus]|uniref:hypothetical protein n=1 Tax=Streptomyces asiaticus TaxID=114695 RepID=UPI001BA74029|nr:hypothetical protein [Streptomyces asiaticus]
MTEEARPELLTRLRTARRARMARRGDHGPVVKSLHDLADVMELDQFRSTRYRRDGVRAVTAVMLMRATYGPLLVWDRCAGRYDIQDISVRSETEYGEAKARRDALRQALTDATCAMRRRSPGVLRLRPSDVRAIADRLAVETAKES